MIKNSLRNRRRSALTIGSIAVSLCLLGVLFAMYRAMFLAEATPAQALRLITRHRVSLTQAMPIAYRQKIEQIPGVRQVMVWQWFGGTYKDNRDPKNFFARFAAEPDRLFTVHPEYQMPPDQIQAFQRQRTACVVSRTLADKLNFKVGDRINIIGDIFPVNLELNLVGIFDEPQGEETLYFNREYLRDALGPSNARGDQVGAFLIEANSADDVPRIAKTIDDLFDNAPQPTKTESERAFQLSFANFVGNLKLFILLICGAVTFTVLLVSANTISMSVRERVREVGIMKTLGFTQGNILGIIIGESAFIAVIGGLLGCGLAQLLCAGVRNSPGAVFLQALKQLSLTPGVALLCLTVALLVGLVSSLLPALGAARTSILESLRYSG
jgi:putative ABC transport system permease protein